MRWQNIFGIGSVKIMTMYKLGTGQYIGVNDCQGNRIHIGDTLEFDEKEFGEKCVFVVELKDGTIQHPGATSDLTNWCTVINSWKTNCDDQLQDIHDERKWKMERLANSG